jgi:hypothetical protein
MPNKTIDKGIQRLVLQAEIAALLHDIGKFTKQFVESKVPSNGKKGANFDHAWDFLEKSSPACNRKLKEILNQDLPQNWLKIPHQRINLKALGDLLRLHHAKNGQLSKWLNWNDKKEPIPPLIAMIMIADSIDSSTSKGGAAFLISKEENRNARLVELDFKQNIGDCYLATPFGEKEADIDLKNLEKRSDEFQEKLALILEGYESWDLEDLISTRKEMLKLMEMYLSSALAETRLPTNDVSLWQHSYSTASIFKAILAGRLIAAGCKGKDGGKIMCDNPELLLADEDGDLAHYRANLSFLGIRWSEEKLLSRSVRPKDILARRARLFNLMEAIKKEVEIAFCLGNEFYRDRNGICFLIPSANQIVDDGYNLVEDIKDTTHNLLNIVESHLNSNNYFPGDLHYKILQKDVGIQVLGLTDIISENDDRVDVLISGPVKPGWIESWKNSGSNKEICTRCGLRPTKLVPSSMGSQMDESKICDFCSRLLLEGKDIRNYSKDMRRQFLGFDEDASFFTYETDNLLPKDTENPRLALVQGIFDLRPFISGSAFCSLLARRPEDYSKSPGKGDKSVTVDNWDGFLNGVKDALENIRNRNNETVLHTLQQVFHDTFLGTKKDGRVPGKDEWEKLRNYIEQIVLKSPFPQGLEKHQMAALYALRQHPAPSRITRMWKTTEYLCRQPIAWCEENHVRYFPVGFDPGRFLILIPANRAWQLLQAAYKSYLDNVGRVRHLLPFHLSVSVFSKKFPLYIGIDSMQRFAKLQLNNRLAPASWVLKEKEKMKKSYVLKWFDQQGREISWNMPIIMPNGREERFFTQFWIDGKKWPIGINEIEKGSKAFIWPSTFDYEVLDSSTRRYDIRFSECGNRRPHLFCGEKGPRPYPLENLEIWEQNPDINGLKSIEFSQINRLITFLTPLHREWHGFEHELRQQASDYVALCLGKRTNILTDMAVSGALFDKIEWDHLISK